MRNFKLLKLTVKGHKAQKYAFCLEFYGDIIVVRSLIAIHGFTKIVCHSSIARNSILILKCLVFPHIILTFERYTNEYYNVLKLSIYVWQKVRRWCKITRVYRKCLYLGCQTSRVILEQELSR